MVNLILLWKPTLFGFCLPLILKKLVYFTIYITVEYVFDYSEYWGFGGQVVSALAFHL